MKKWAHWKLPCTVRNRQAHWSAEWTALEDDVYGTITTDPILNRVDNLYDYINGYAGSGEASFLTKLNAVEWQFTESTAGGPAKSRIEALETMLNGEVGAGSLAWTP